MVEMEKEEEKNGSDKKKVFEFSRVSKDST